MTERPVVHAGTKARARFALLLCSAALCASAAAASGLAAQVAGPPSPGPWRAIGPQFKGTFTVTPDDRYVTHFHGVALAGARNGCPVVHAGEAVVLPARIPITHVVSNNLYDVQAQNKSIVLLPLKTTVIVGGKRHAGAIEISWASQPDAQADITYGNLAQACHISFFAVPPTG